MFIQQTREVSMRRLFTFISLVILSLFIMSATKSCYNADLIAVTDANDLFKNTSIEYIAMDTKKPIPTTTPGLGEDVNEFIITTDKKTGDKIIKNASLWLGYSQVDENGEKVGEGGVYTVSNKNYFLDTLIYPSDKARLSEWLGTPPKPTDTKVFAELVVIYARHALLGEDPYDINYVFDILTKAFYMPIIDEDGSELIMEKIGEAVYDYEAILVGDADHLTTINFKNTVEIKKDIPNAAIR